MQTGVLNVVRSDRLFPLDLYINVHADGPRHRRLVCPLVCEEQTNKQHRAGKSTM